MKYLDSIEHHALFFERKNKQTLSVVIDLIKKSLEGDLVGNPDVIVFETEKFLIEDARKIKDTSLGAPISEKYRHIIISFYGATTDAQNALLKALEEPTDQVKFYIIAPKKSLIKTIISRLFEVSFLDKENLYSKQNDFLSKSTGEQLQFVEDLATKLKDEKITKEEIVEFLYGCKEACMKDPKKYQKKLEAINIALKYISDNSASVKQLLSIVALS